MARDKLMKFAQLSSFENTLEFPENIQGKWGSDVFGNDQPIVLELACGKGAYTLALAERFADKNFIGVDRKGERIWRGAKTALDDKKANVRFLRIFIEKLGQFFAKGEVDEIWITFPDPFPKDRHAKRRLTAPGFLEIYRKILKPGGLLKLKTDSDLLYEFSLETLNEAKGLEVVAHSPDVYKEDFPDPLVTEIKTDYEVKHLADGRTITYIESRFD